MDKNFSVYIGQVKFYYRGTMIHIVLRIKNTRTSIKRISSKYTEKIKKRRMPISENIDYVKEQQEIQNEKARKEREEKGEEDKSKDESQFLDVDPWMKNKESSK